ncbi:hypothetical protein C0J52_09420 [Blattella germanica]|nr:hypothetical protein C0J52_09420 [Blattella germanica]
MDGSDTTEETVDDVLQKMVVQAPPEYIRPKNALPFHIPHKKVLEQFEEKIEKSEPVVGFLDNQRRRRHEFHEDKVDESSISSFSRGMK